MLAEPHLLSDFFRVEAESGTYRQNAFVLLSWRVHNIFVIMNTTTY